jgi:hypothetical protein
MKDFDIAKYLREHQLGSYGILNHYVDLKPLNEEAEVGVKEFNEYIRKNYPHIYHNLRDAEVQEFLNQRHIKSLPIQKKANFFTDYIVSQGLGDVVAEDVTPEEIAEIPYEGPEPKLDGLGDEFEQAEIVSEDEEDFNPVYTRIDWEDLDDTDLNGASMEMAINDLIDDASSDIKNAMMSDPTLARLAQANPTQAEAQIRLLIKKLWMNKIQNWRARN